jgi:V/A-type H+/Na+-transporting ATPase subunit D
MAKVKLTKNEQKKQKDALKMYTRYLPTLILKKQQLQMEIRKVEERAAEVKAKKEALEEEFRSWIAVFGEDVGLDSTVLRVKDIVTSTGNIAGVPIPIFESAEFYPASYDLFEKPLWVDKAVSKLEKLMLYDLEYEVLEKQVELLNKELRTTSQRVNLFEKVMIPETKANIKKIGVYLGDQQTAAVVRGKISKRKLKVS